MEERERCLMEQPVAVLRAHAQECGLHVHGALEKRDLVRMIMRAEPQGNGSTGRRAQSTRSQDAMLAADEQLARRLQAEEESLRTRVGAPRGDADAAVESLAEALSGLFRARAAAQGAAMQSVAVDEQLRGLSTDGRAGDPRIDILSRVFGPAATTSAPRATRGVNAGEASPTPGVQRRSNDPINDVDAPQNLGDPEAAAHAVVGLIGQALSRGDMGGARVLLSALLGGMSPEQGIDSDAVDARTITTTVTEQDVGARGQNLSDEHRQCMVCLENFSRGDEVRILPCLHRYHKSCVDPWLAQNRHCPVCKHDVTQ